MRAKVRPLLVRAGVKTHEQMKKLFNILSDKKSFYIAFLLMHLISIAWLLISSNSNALEYMSFNRALLLRAAALIIYFIIAFLSFKGFKFATWLMVVILLFTGIGNTALGLFRIGWDQYILKPYYAVLGLYFLFGASALVFYAAKRKERF